MPRSKDVVALRTLMYVLLKHSDCIYYLPEIRLLVVLIFL